MTGPQEIEDNCILDEDTAYAPAAHCAIIPQLSRNQAAESGICYVCHAGGAEGEFWVGCGNLGRHTEVDGWAHGTCVGFNRPPGPEVEWWCHDCEIERNQRRQYKNEKHQRAINTNIAGFEGLSQRDTGSRATSLIGSLTQTYESSVHKPSGRGTWNSGGNGVADRLGNYFPAPQASKRFAARATSAVKDTMKASKKHKRTPGAEETLDRPESEEPRPKRTKDSQGIHDKHVKDLITGFLQDEIKAGNKTEQKWQAVSEKLAQQGIQRSRWSIKAWWSREGRLETGFDERTNPVGRKLVTSKQDPEERRKARERRKAELRQTGVQTEVGDL
ncbi:MAG: hypothetical protein Q9188_002156 [Gyalolechia gomerana]